MFGILKTVNSVPYMPRRRNRFAQRIQDAEMASSASAFESMKTKQRRSPPKGVLPAFSGEGFFSFKGPMTFHPLKSGALVVQQHFPKISESVFTETLKKQKEEKDDSKKRR